jgi:hypothetical protein
MSAIRNNNIFFGTNSFSLQSSKENNNNNNNSILINSNKTNIEIFNSWNNRNNKNNNNTIENSNISDNDYNNNRDDSENIIMYSPSMELNNSLIDTRGDFKLVSDRKEQVNRIVISNDDDGDENEKQRHCMLLLFELDLL